MKRRKEIGAEKKSPSGGKGTPSKKKTIEFTTRLAAKGKET